MGLGLGLGSGIYDTLSLPSRLILFDLSLRSNKWVMVRVRVRVRVNVRVRVRVEPLR